MQKEADAPVWGSAHRGHGTLCVQAGDTGKMDLGRRDPGLRRPD